MDLDFGTILLLVTLLLAPAVIVFSVLTVIRIRRGKFHRQRITKKSSSSSSSGSSKSGSTKT